MTVEPVERQLLPPLSSGEQADLRADIEAHGVLVPIVVSTSGVILDGHHRKAIADELQVDCPVQTVDLGGDVAREAAYALRANLNRRNLSLDQRAEVTRQQAKLAKDWSKAGWTQAQIGAEIGVSQKTVSNWLSKNSRVTNVTKTRGAKSKLDKNGRESAFALVVEEGVSQAQAAADLGVSQKTISNVVAAEKKRREPPPPAKPIHADNLRIEVCQAAELQVENVDLIFTDPPYETAAYFTDDGTTPAWTQLAELAQRALKPGGLLVTYSGQTHLPHSFTALAGLEYVWCGAVVHDGAFFQFQKHKIQVGWKPILIYGKPPIRIGGWWTDTVDVGRREKSFHGWQQSEAEAAWFIEAFTNPGDLIVDPFVGGGTTAAAAKTLNRAFVGCDINPTHVEATRTRLYGDE